MLFIKTKIFCVFTKLYKIILKKKKIILFLIELFVKKKFFLIINYGI